MAKQLSIFGRLFANLRNSFYVPKNTAKFIGQDEFGNKYMEKQGDYSHNLRAARYIEEKRGLDISFVPEVPVEWDAWLRGRRKDPPTNEEIARNYQVMMQTKLRAEEIDKKYSSEEGQESEVKAVGETVSRNPKNVAFPDYGDEFEISPGQKARKKT